jgi:hypothetical protein
VQNNIKVSSYNPSCKSFIPGTHVAVTQLVEALRYKPEGRGFDS